MAIVIRGRRWAGLWLIGDLAEFCLQRAAQDSQNCLDTTMALESASWQHIVATHDGQTTRLYVNGQPAGEKRFDRGAISISLYELFIGADQYNSPVLYTRGVLDDIRIYKRALSAGEVEKLFQEETQEGE